MQLHMKNIRKILTFRTKVFRRSNLSRRMAFARNVVISTLAQKVQDYIQIMNVNEFVTETKLIATHDMIVTV